MLDDKLPGSPLTATDTVLADQSLTDESRSIAAVAPDPFANDRRTELIARLTDFGPVGMFLVVVIIFSLIAPHFFSKAYWLATSEYVVEYLLLALGQTFVLASGGIDISVGAILGFSGMLGAYVMASLMGTGTGSGAIIVAGFLICLLAGAAIGFLNGLVITKFQVHAFIVTLGTLTILTGGVDLISDGNEIGNIPNRINTIGNYLVFGWVSIPVVITIGACLVCALLLNRTRFGARTAAIGSSMLSARRAGININQHLVKVYAFSGLLAGLAGFLVTAHFASASPLNGTNDELYAIAGVVIGGASLSGGRGTILGTTVGTALIAVLTTALILLNIEPFWEEVIIGLILIIAVSADQARIRLLNR
jgi:ribose transport system permease protein